MRYFDKMRYFDIIHEIKGFTHTTTTHFNQTNLRLGHHLEVREVIWMRRDRSVDSSRVLNSWCSPLHSRNTNCKHFLTEK